MQVEARFDASPFERGNFGKVVFHKVDLAQVRWLEPVRPRSRIQQRQQSVYGVLPSPNDTLE